MELCRTGVLTWMVPRPKTSCPPTIARTRTRRRLKMCCISSKDTRGKSQKHTTKKTDLTKRTQLNMKTRTTIIAAIPVLMLAVVAYAQEPTAAAKAKAKPEAAGAIEVNAITATS